MDLRNLTQLYTFIDVSETMSFSHTAQRLSITQPAVSRHIKELETAVGVPLLDRRHQGLAMTEVGYALLAHAENIRASVEQMQRGMANIDGDVVGHLKVGVTPVWEFLIPRLLEEFKARHPRFEFSLLPGNNFEVVDLMRRRTIHLGFVAEDPGIKEFDAIPVLDDELVIVAPPGHELLKNMPVSPSALNGVPLIHRGEESVTAHICKLYLNTIGVRVNTVMELESHDAIKRAAKEGHGVAMVSTYAVQEELDDGSLVRIQLEAPPCTRSLFVLRDRTRFFSPTQNAFIAVVAESVAVN